MENKAMIAVMCISERKGFPGQLKVDERYILDRMTIWIDIDGDAYGTFYDRMMNRVGELKLSHFRCL